jgi:hypothetical protein
MVFWGLSYSRLGGNKKDELAIFLGAILGTNLSSLGVGFMAHLKCLRANCKVLQMTYFKVGIQVHETRKHGTK